MSDTDNLSIWNTLGKTDPAHTKGFKRAGGFSGTAIKPIWAERLLTSAFGPCGEGWGNDDPVYTTMPGANNEVLVYCTVRAWYRLHGEDRAYLTGIGGDKVVKYVAANEKYDRPERWESDDEAFKKAFTDALMNAFKHIGLGADVHMGQFDDSKYVDQVDKEYRAEEKRAARDGKKLDGKYTSMTALEKAIKEFVTSMGTVANHAEWYALKNESADLLAQAQSDKPDWWNGWAKQPDGFTPLKDRIASLEAYLDKEAGAGEFDGVDEGDLR